MKLIDRRIYVSTADIELLRGWRKTLDVTDYSKIFVVWDRFAGNITDTWELHSVKWLLDSARWLLNSARWLLNSARWCSGNLAVS
jgi:hypothetical protein